MVGGGVGDALKDHHRASRKEPVAEIQVVELELQHFERRPAVRNVRLVHQQVGLPLVARCLHLAHTIPRCLVCRTGIQTPGLDGVSSRCIADSQGVNPCDIHPKVRKSSILQVSLTYRSRAPMSVRSSTSDAGAGGRREWVARTRRGRLIRGGTRESRRIVISC
eukprot:809101-Prymnesium_polylepis.1